MRRGSWLPIAVTVGFMLVAPLALAAEETVQPQQATEQTQQPATPEVPAPQGEAQPAQAGEQPPPQAGEQPPPPGELLHPGIGERKVGEQGLGAPPPQAGPLPSAVECIGTPGPSEPGKPKKLNPCLGNKEAIKNGQQLFWRTGCEACHGPTGGGAMPGAPKLYDRDWKFGGDDQTVFNLIKGKIPNQTMPNIYHLLLNDMQVWNIISWIRTLYNDDPEFIVW